MNAIAKLFDENFTTLATSAEGIAKLRELILQLAVRGKLVPQDHNDEPACVLLENIIKEKNRRITLKEFNTTILEDKPFLESVVSLPKNWIRCRIGDVCELKTGATPSTSRKDYFGGDIKWLVSGDINKGIIYDCEGRITKEGMNNSNCKLIASDSVLIALNGQGKTRATVAMLKTEATCNQSLVAMIPVHKQYLVPEYLFWNLKGKYRAIRDITGQKQRRGLNMKLVGSLSLELPPLAEQNRIVARVNHLMALCDTLEQQLHQSHQTHRQLNDSAIHHLLTAENVRDFEKTWKLICDNFGLLYNTEENVDKLRQAILQLAVQGKLVPQDPKDEPAEKLLEKIQAEKDKLIKEGKLRKENPLLPIKDDEIPYALPKGWQWARLNDICYVITDGEHLTPKYADKGTPILSAMHIGEKNIIWDDLKYVSEQDAKIFRRKCSPDIGDILVVSRGGGVGRTIISDRTEFCLMGSVLLFKPSNYLISNFLLCFLNCSVGNQKLKTTSSSTAQPAIYISHLKRDYILPVAPLAEQKRIVAKVDKLMALCDQLQERIKSARTQAQQLTASTIHHLLAG